MSPTQPCGPEVIEVVPSKTYRVRAVGGLALALISFAFEDHDNLSVIAADGRYTKPSSVRHMQIGPGQRFDFLLTTKSSAELAKLGKTQFWVQFETRARPINVTSYALLRYTTNHYSDWLEGTLLPLQDNGFPRQATRRVYPVSARISNNVTSFWTVTNRTWTETDEHVGASGYYTVAQDTAVPYLVKIFEAGEAAIPNYSLALQSGGWNCSLNVWAARIGEVIDIVLVNEPEGVTGGFDVHPWHIHGGHVYDLGSGRGQYDPSAIDGKLQTYTPVLRDTMYLYRYTTGDGLNLEPYTHRGWRAWRLKVQDAG